MCANPLLSLAGLLRLDDVTCEFDLIDEDLLVWQCDRELCLSHSPLLLLVTEHEPAEPSRVCL